MGRGGAVPAGDGAVLGWDGAVFSDDGAVLGREGAVFLGGGAVPGCGAIVEWYVCLSIVLLTILTGN